MSALLETRDLQLAFGAVVVADHIDFTLEAGERLAVIGQNGAGKTTFINICTGLIRPQAGQVFFEGREVTKLSPREIALREGTVALYLDDTKLGRMVWRGEVQAEIRSGSPDHTGRTIAGMAREIAREVPQSKAPAP